MGADAQRWWSFRVLTFTDNDVIIDLLLTENDDYIGINGYAFVMNA